MDKEPVYTTDYSSLLEGVMIAAPCNVGWENMKGDDRVRFCGQCQLNVYNTSVMTPREIEKLLSGEGQLPCLRLYRRADGTLLTENCPVGLRKIRAGYRKLARFATAFWTLIASISSAWAQAGDSVKMGETGSIEARKKDAVHAKTHPGDAISAQMNDGFSSKADLLASREFQMACLAKQRAKKAEAELHFKKAIVALVSQLTRGSAFSSNLYPASGTTFVLPSLTFLSFFLLGDFYHDSHR